MAEKTNTQRRVGRTLLVVVGALVALIVAALAAVPYFIPWDKVKAEAEIKLTELLNHPVSVEAIRFNVFTGIEIRNLRIDNAAGFSDQPLLSDEAAIVRYRLLPLLIGRVMIKTVELRKPELVIERNAAGRFNFSDMLPQKPKPESPEPAEARPAARRLPVELLVSQFLIQDASFTYRDLGSRRVTRLDALNLNVQNLTLAGLTPVKIMFSTDAEVKGAVIPVRAEAEWRLRYREGQFVLDRLTAGVPGADLVVAGTVDRIFDQPVLDLSGTLDADWAKLWARLKPLAPAKLQQTLALSGNAAVRVQAKGPVSDVQALAVQVEDEVHLQAAVSGLELPADLKGSLSWKQAGLTLAQTVTLAGSRTELKARLTDALKARRLTATFSSQLDLAKTASPWLTAASSPALAGASLAGSIQAKGTVSGSLATPESLNGSLNVKAEGLGFKLKEAALLENLQGTLTLTPTQLRLPNLTAKLGGQSVKVSFQASGFDLRVPQRLKPETLTARADASLDSPLLDLDALLALLPAKSPGPDTARNAPAPDRPSAPEPDVRAWIPAGLVFKGKANLGGLKFGEVKLGQMTFTAGLEKRLLTETGNLAGYQGTIQETLRLDFSQPTLGFGVDAETKNVDVEPLMNDIVQTFMAAKLKKPELVDELKGKLTGRLNGTLGIRGQGLRAATLKQTLTGRGAFTLLDGRLRKLAFQDVLAQLFGSDTWRQDLPFDHTVVEFTLGDERARVTRFVAESGPQGRGGEIRLTAEGDLAYTADFRNFRLQPQLSPRASASLSPEFSQYAAALRDDQGWVTIPVVLNGPIRKPDVQPDWEWIKAQMGALVNKKATAAAEQAKQKAGEFIQQQQGKSADEVQQNLNQELEKAKDQLKNLNLQNLFK